MKQLSVHIRKRDNFKRSNKSFEDDLFLTYFPQTYSQQLDLDTSLTLQGQLSSLTESVLSPCRKRGFSKITQAEAVEHTKKKHDSFSDKTYSTGKGIGPRRKKRRGEGLTCRARSSNLSSPHNKKNRTHYTNS